MSVPPSPPQPERPETAPVGAAWAEPDVPAARPAKSRALALGVIAGVAASALLGVPLLYAAYKRGRARGVAAERVRLVEKVAAYQDEPLPVDPDPAEVRRIRKAFAELRGNSTSEESPKKGVSGKGFGKGTLSVRTPGGESGADAGAGGPQGEARRSIRVFGPRECVRVIWPMEIVPADEQNERPRFRLRQGANRLCRPGTGVAEFVFRLARRRRLGVFVRARYSDECGNSLTCRVDGGRTTIVVGGSAYDRWIWRPARGIFALGPGLHRLTVGTCEDGVEFDRVVVRPIEGKALTPRHHGILGGPSASVGAQWDAAYMKGLDYFEPTPPPVFESMPLTSPTLPAIGRVSAQASATGSLVVGEGHANTLAVFTRLNGRAPADKKLPGRVVVRCPWASYYTAAEFELSAGKRSELTVFDLSLTPRGQYLMPLRTEVYLSDELVHTQRIDFVRPLSWALLGPFPDPRAKGLDLELPPDGMIDRLHRRPEFKDHEWRIIEDGRCYNSLGVVDLNAAFGLPRERWSRRAQRGSRYVAYAVTAIASHGTRHDTLAFAFDDAGEVWLNGEPLLRARGCTPIELNRQVVGAKLRRGVNWFVFKVAQRGFYWHILMEPDNSFPYGRTDNFLPLPVDRWPARLIEPAPPEGGK
jgi:hypothetical protein